MRKRNIWLYIITFALLLALLPVSVFAATSADTEFGLETPGDYKSCKPADEISVTGMPDGSKAMMTFTWVVDGELKKLGTVTVMAEGGVASAPFPYPEIGQGDTVFAVFVAVIDSSDKVLGKLRDRWTITCVEETPTPTQPTPTKEPTPTKTPTPPPTPTETPTKPPPKFEGCTPGYWRQPQHLDSWVGYEPTDLFMNVFGDGFVGMDLLEVVWLGGGGLNALGRHTVAALLNAANPDVNYPYTTDQVIDMFEAAFNSGEYESLKNNFESYNELGCPLN